MAAFIKCILSFSVVLLPVLSCSDSNKPVKKLLTPSLAHLSPEESMKTFVLPDGYSLELVASEPMIREPVAITWDGDGKLFVLEMLSYMQNADAGGEQERVSRVSLLIDTNNDGRMDRSTVFVDSLLLPRMMQTVDNKLLLNESNSLDIYSYADTNGDGIADQKTQVYTNRQYSSGKNIEHQHSGLDWNVDNWMYITSEPVRFRYATGIMHADTLPEDPGGQWGVTHDDFGRLFFSNAGGEMPALSAELNPAYGTMDSDSLFAPGFQEVWPIIPTPDVEGGHARLRDDKTLNHFTSPCGQSVFRGNRLPEDMAGNYFICEPAGRLVRRARITNYKGNISLENVYDKQEFIASSDMNFRPVNTATGPDGNLYIADMHRGIIQQGAWTGKGTYLRSQIDSLGLEKNTGHGRIYRVVHKDFTKRPPKPEMLNKDPYDLLEYLDHPNGWWRDNAQKQIIARGDKSLVPALKQMAAGKKGFQVKPAGDLGRFHALWTLEGLDAIDKGLLLEALKDKHPQIRRSAIQISELYLKWNDRIILETLRGMTDDDDHNVRLQLFLSLHRSASPEAREMIVQLMEKNSGNKIFSSAKQVLDKTETIRQFNARLGSIPDENDRALISNGRTIYNSTCSACHGKLGDENRREKRAPSLLTSPRVHTEKEKGIKILLHGMEGPIDGQNYPGIMPGMGNQNDEWVAACLSYIRYAAGSANDIRKILITPEEVKKIRKKESSRNRLWTIGELESVNTVENRLAK